MKYSFLITLVLFVFSQFPVQGQKIANTRAEFDSLYRLNIKMSHIHDVYIPQSLLDAFDRLNELSPPASIEKFKMADEDLVCRKLHYGLGKWMIVNWNFYDGSRFSHYLKRKGLLHPDDKAQFVLRTYHRFLNEKDLNEKEIIDEFAKQRKAYAEELRKKIDSKK